MATAEPLSTQTAVDVRTSLGGPIALPGFKDLQPPSGSQVPTPITVDEPVSSIPALLTQAVGHPSSPSIGGTVQATFTTQALGGLAAPIARRAPPTLEPTHAGTALWGTFWMTCPRPSVTSEGHTSQGASASRFPRTFLESYG